MENKTCFKVCVTFSFAGQHHSHSLSESNISLALKMAATCNISDERNDNTNSDNEFY